MHKTLLSALAIFGVMACSAQFQVRDSSLFNPHVSIGYAYQLPGGDMADRFGNCHNISLGFHIKSKTNWYYGVQANYLFGEKVTEKGLIQNLYTDDGYILDINGQISKVIISQRGFAVSSDFGRLFPFGYNPNSGLLVYAGVGLLQHKIRIEHEENKIPQLEDEYLKGYDRLTNGLALTQFVGYMHMSNNRYINFFVGAEAWQGFTQSRRAFNFDTQTADTAKRLDILLGLRAGWTLNLYVRNADNYYYY